MAVYLCTFFITILLMKLLGGRKPVSNIAIDNNKKNTSFVNDQLRILLVMFPLWFISAFRYDVGTDYFFTYVKYYLYEKQYGWKSYTEPLFQLLNTCVVNLGLDYVWIFIITSFIILFCVFNLIYKYSDNPIISFIVFFVSGTFFCTFNNVRQYVAIFIALFSFYQKGFLKSAIPVLFASMFHLTALLFLPIVICSRIPIKKLDLIFISLLIIPLAYVVLFVFDVILDNSKYSYFQEVGGFSLLLILVNVILYILCLYYYRDNDRKSEFGMLVRVQLCAVVFCVVSVLMQNEELWVRVIRMPAALQMFLVPQLLRKERNKYWRVAVFIAILLMFSIYTLYTFYFMGGLDVFPYKFYFTNI